MNKIITMAVLAGMSCLASAGELIEFKKGDVATAAAFNNNFTVALEKAEDSQTKATSNEGVIATLLTRIEELESTLTSQASTIGELESRPTPQVDVYELVDSDLQSMGTLIFGTLGNGIVRYNDIIYHFANGIQMESTEPVFLDNTCEGQAYTYPDLSMMAYRFLADSITIIDRYTGNIYAATSNSTPVSVTEYYYKKHVDDINADGKHDVSCELATNPNDPQFSPIELLEPNKLPPQIKAVAQDSNGYISYRLSVDAQVHLKLKD